MSIGLKSLPILYAINGIRLGAAEAGFKKGMHRDLVVIELAEGSSTAAVFTQNAFRAAPVLVAEKHLAGDNPRYLLINSGNANAGTGVDGIRNAETSCQLLADLADCKPSEVLPFSTGVIGKPLPMEPLAKGLPMAYQELSEIGWADAAQAILTTDTVPKGVSEIIHIGDQSLRITGIAKGAGMIHPNMATMLAYIGTDAKVPKHVLQAILAQTVKGSFNRITVDGDTSTNDACVLVATGRGEVVIEDTDSPGFAEFLQAVMAVTRDLAQSIIRDAEGATKFITIEVDQAGSEQEAEQVAFTIAHSPLVKTAFFGKDANWGRILAAIGRADIPQLDISKVSILLDEFHIVRNGALDPDYEEEMGQIVMARPDITLRVGLDRGNQSARVWTSDLSHDYVSINADYRS